MTLKVAVSFSTMAPSIEKVSDNTEEKIFKRYINRKNIEDSLFEESREGLSKKGKHKGILSPSMSLKPMGSFQKDKVKRVTAYDIFNGSPRKPETNPLLRAIPGRQNFRRPEVSELAKYLETGDKVSKKQPKSHPLTIFVGGLLI